MTAKRWYWVLVVFGFVVSSITAYVFFFRDQYKEEKIEEAQRAISPTPFPPQENEIHDFALTETGKHYVYDTLGMRKLTFNVRVRGEIRQEGDLYILPVSLDRKNLELVLAHEDGGFLYEEVRRQRLGSYEVQGVLVKDIASEKREMIQGIIRIRMDVEETEMGKIEGSLSSPRCTRMCVVTLTITRDHLANNRMIYDYFEEKIEIADIPDNLRIGPIEQLTVRDIR